MAKYHVTIRATLATGILYWVTDVNSGSEENALKKAVEGFEREIDAAEDWNFSDYEIEIVQQNVGRTTRAGINVALNLASKVKGKNMLVIGYDKADRYDS